MKHNIANDLICNTQGVLNNISNHLCYLNLYLQNYPKAPPKTKVFLKINTKKQTGIIVTYDPMTRSEWHSNYWKAKCECESYIKLFEEAKAEYKNFLKKD